MDWRQKAAIQRLVSLLPRGLSHKTYYWMQQNWGGLRGAGPVARLRAGILAVERIQSENRPIASKRFLEIGTGHQLGLPIALWLCGASEITTVDINTYLKPELVLADIDYIRSNRQEILSLFGHHAHGSLFRRRFEILASWSDQEFAHLLQVMNTRYMAPMDASRLGLESHSFDYHVSYAVLEHIPPNLLIKILVEGRRVLNRYGLFVHCIDFSDHFAHSDRSITSVNFLRFSQEQWKSCAGNRFMYHNRLRIDELQRLLNEAHLCVLSLVTEVDREAQEQLERGMRLGARFRWKSPEVNATATAWVVASPSSDGWE